MLLSSLQELDKLTVILDFARIQQVHRVLAEGLLWNPNNKHTEQDPSHPPKPPPPSETTTTPPTLKPRLKQALMSHASNTTGSATGRTTWGFRTRRVTLDPLELHSLKPSP